MKFLANKQIQCCETPSIDAEIEKLEIIPSSEYLLKNDWSQMPVEMLIMIFHHLKPEDQCIKEITESCRTFKEICESRLTHLHLDFETIGNAGGFLLSHRSYKEISVVNFELPMNMLDLLNLFQSSVESVRKLNIGDIDQDSFNFISKEALRFLFRCFPNIEELKITRTTMTQRSNLDICRNDLPSLKKLHLHDVTDDVIRSMIHVTWLEELRITGCFHTDSDDFKSLISDQTNLTLLETNPTFINSALTVIPSLQTFIGVACADIESLFEFAPNLKHLELTVVEDDDVTCTSMFLRSCRSDVLITLKLNDFRGNVEEFLQNFPSLKISKCSPNLMSGNS